MQMVLSRLFLPETRLHLQRKGVLKPSRLFSSSSSTSSKPKKTSQSKKSEAARHLETHPGVFPKAKQVQYWEFWNPLKEFFKDLKEKVIGNPQSQMQITSETPMNKSSTSADVMVDTPMKDEILDGTGLCGSKSRVQQLEVVKKSHSRKKIIETYPTSHVTCEKFPKSVFKSEDSTDILKLESIELRESKSRAPQSEAITDSQTRKKFIAATDEKFDSTELCGSKSRVQPLEPVMESHSHEKTIASNPTSHVTGKKSSTNIVTLEDYADVLRLESIKIFVSESRASQSEAITDSQGHDKYMLASQTSHVTEEKSSRNVVQPKDSADSVKLVEPESRYWHHKAISSSVVGPDCGHKVESEQDSCWTHQLVSREEATRPSREAGSVEATLDENGDHHLSKKILVSCSAPNGNSKVMDTTAPPGSGKAFKSLAYLFMRREIDTRAIDKIIYKESQEEATSLSGKAGSVEATLDENRDHHLGKKILVSHLAPNGSSKMMGIAAPPGSGETFKWSTDLFMRRKMDAGATYKITSKDNNKKFRVDCIKELPRELLETGYLNTIISNKSDQLINRGFLGDSNPASVSCQNILKNRQSWSDDHVMYQGTSQLDDNKEKTIKKVPLKKFKFQFLREDESVSGSNAAAFKPKSSPQIPLPMDKEALKKNPEPFLFTEKGEEKSIILLRFVPKPINKSIIDASFGDCGPIAKTEVIPSRNESRFQDAYIYFKTKKGVQKALEKIDPVVGLADVVVEATSLLFNMHNRIPVPNLIGDPDIPAALVKNPTRTVMVKGLPCNVALHHLRDTFAFCGGRISGFIMGSSSSVAYIEFETEDAKEKAIAKSTVSISGRWLPILRIDVPITTIVRLSNVDAKTGEILAICNLQGQVKRVVRRSNDTFDVHFSLAEWPNMVKILNSLNGKVVNEHQLLAQPATVIPVKILQSLWSQPDGRRQVHAVFQSLCGKLEQDSTSAAAIKGLAAMYFGEGA